MSDSFRGNVYLVLLTSLFFYIAVSYNACSDVNFKVVGTPDGLNLAAGNPNQDPAVLINGGAAYTRESLVNLSLNGPDAAEMRISNTPSCDDGEWEPYVTSKSWELAAGNSEGFVFVTYKNADGTETECVTDGIVHDDIEPAIVYENIQNIFSNETSNTVRFAVADNLSGLERVQCGTSLGGQFVDCVDQRDFSNLGDGPQVLFVKAVDKAGNEAPPLPYNWTVDTVPPVVEINLQPAALSNSFEGDFVFSGTDEISGVALYECWVQGASGATPGAWQVCEANYQYVAPAEDSYELKVRAVDNAGNVSEEVPATWAIDATAPAVTITRQPDVYTNETLAEFEFEGSDNGNPITIFECRLGETATYETCTSPMSYSGLAQGPYQFFVRGQDLAGNYSEPASFDWTVDVTIPTVIIDQHPAAVNNEDTANFVFIPSDDLSGIDRSECSLDNGAYEPCDLSAVYSGFVEGEHNFSVRTYDRAGNLSEPATYDWVVDRTAPVVEITAGPEALTVETTASFSFAAADEGSGIAGYECRLDGAVDYQSCSSPLDPPYEALLDGAHNFYVRATDNAGNTSEPRTYPWMIDTTPPEIQFVLYPLEPVNVGGTAQISFTVTDLGSGVQSYSCLYDGVEYAACLMGEVLLLENQVLGARSFRVVAEDGLGNASMQEVVWSVEQEGYPVSDFKQIVDNNKVDILFVIDDSGSMEDDQVNLSDKIGGFLGRLTQLDWQIALTTTAVRKSPTNIHNDGRLLELEGLQGEYILDDSMDPATAQTILENSIEVGINGSGKEEGIYATYRAIERYDESGTVNDSHRSFFRDEANFATILISDEDETIHQAAHFNQPTELIDLLSTKWPNKSFFWNSIVVRPGDQACIDLQHSRFPSTQTYGILYAELTSLTGGILADICADDYTSQLEDIGDRVRDLQRTISLQCAPLGNVSVQYQATASDPFVEYTDNFMIDQLSLTFDNYLPTGNYQLEYECISPPSI